MENRHFEPTQVFASMLEGTDCEFCLQHPIFGFFVNKNDVIFSISLCLVFFSVVVFQNHQKELRQCDPPPRPESHTGAA